jgi:hypothetical protein
MLHCEHLQRGLLEELKLRRVAHPDDEVKIFIEQVQKLVGLEV